MSSMAAPETAAIRISLGWTFLWAFLDKMFALGHETGVDATTGAVDYFGPAAWIHGGYPTAGFLGHAVEGPLAGFYSRWPASTRAWPVTRSSTGSSCSACSASASR